MKNTYRASSKSGPIVTRKSDINNPRNVVFGGDKCARWKRPCSKKTAAELLYQDDDKEGQRERLTPVQRQTLEDRAGKAYVKRDPFSKRPTESVEAYVARINRLVG